VAAPERPAAISERETDVLRLLARGRATEGIALELSISNETVKSHISSILSKLGVQSRTHAVLHAGRIGLVPLDQFGAAELVDQQPCLLSRSC
jgi:DNA-binding NarL/FixJ family response regulator